MTASIRLEESTEAAMLASRILAPGKDRIVVSSCEDRAGTTTLCRILARYAIQSQRRRVVYVDLNLRHPASAELFSNPAFSERFEFRQLGENFNALEDWQKRERIETVLRPTGEDALVIVDTSPLGIFNRNNVHPANLAKWCPEIVLVVAQELTRHSQVSAAKNLLASHGIAISGAVLNQGAPVEHRDAASLTGWRTTVHALLRLRREMPLWSTRFKNAFHGLRICWRLVRPAVRNGLEELSGTAPARLFLGFARRLAPAVLRSSRSGLSRIRSRIDRILSKGDRWWTRS